MYKDGGNIGNWLQIKNGCGVGRWYGGMVAREGLGVMQLYYISSCVLVREEGVNGLLGIV